MIWLLILWLLWAAPAGAASFSDTFNRADNTDVGAVWDNTYTGASNMQIVSNVVRCTVITSAECDESLNAPTFGQNQFAQTTLTTWSPGANIQYTWLMLRASAPATVTWYQCTASNDTTYGRSVISRKNAGVETALTNSNGSTWAAGDILRCEVSGANPTLIRLYRNGTQVLTYSDSSPITSTSRVGFGLYIAAGAVTSLELDNFLAGDLNSSRLLMGVGQ